MKDLITQSQYDGIVSRLKINGSGVILLSFLYFFTLSEVGKEQLGFFFLYYCLFHLFLGLSRLTLLFLKKFLQKKQLILIFYFLVTLSSSWWLYGTFYIIQMAKEIEKSSYHDLIQVQFFMLVGILNAIPQFFRHSKWAYIINISLLYCGLFLLVPYYFSSTQTILGASVIIALFAFIITPAHLSNWKFEQEKIETEADLQRIIDGFPGGVSEIKDGVYTRVNLYVKENYINSAPKMLGQPLGYVHGNSQWAQNIKAFTQSQENYALVEHTLPTKQGERWHLTALSKIGENHIVMASVDIQELKEARENAEHQKTMAVEKSRLASLGLMAAGIAHEINNPLAVIQSRTDLLKKLLQGDSTLDKEKVLSNLDKITPMIKRITKIISSMRSLTRNASQDEFEMIAVKSILDDIMILAEEKLKSQNIQFFIEGAALEQKVFCRPTELGQVVINAINNSIQAINSFEDKWIRIQVNRLEENNLIEIKLIDSGQGIPFEIRDKLLTPLFTTKGPGMGTGLGLALSRQIIENHNGYFFFDHASKNTCLVIQVPGEKKEPIDLTRRSA